MSVDLISVQSTLRFIGSEAAPRQVVEVRWRSEPGASVELAVEIDGRPAGRVTVTVTAPGGDPVTTEVGVDPPAAQAPPGAALPMRVTLRAGSGVRELPGTFTVAEPGWRMFMVSHFHYDPVWWTTQAAYLLTWDDYAADANWRPDFMRHGIELVDTHLDLAEADPDYAFVLAELDYLKPYWATRPERRALVRRLLAEGRLELVGAMYNEPNTNLTSGESTTRNALAGIGYQRDVIGGDPRTAWQLDVFGHDPFYPALMRAAGVDSSAWGRGPFHEWGPMTDGVFDTERLPAQDRMQFAAEFDWTSPDGSSLLTQYMAAHYGAGWTMDSSLTLAEAEQATYELFCSIMPVAATRNVLLPTGTDYTPPNRWVTQIHRDWNARYVWPRFTCALPRDFFAAVRAELRADGARLTPQTRDMNPIFTGKDVTYIDTKQAQRAIESALVAAETYGTVAALTTSYPFPVEPTDLAWRQLAFAAHHDAITGTESDQVYLDLLTSWRTAYDAAAGAYRAAVDAIAAAADTRGPGQPVIVANPLGRSRGGRVTHAAAHPVALRGPDGTVLPAVSSQVAGGWLTEAVLDGVPAVGYRVVHAERAASAVRWQRLAGPAISSDRYTVTADPARGGALSSIRAGDRELITAGGLANVLVRYDEHVGDKHGMFGPWIVAPTGSFVRSSDAGQAGVIAERSPVGERLTVTGTLDGISYTQTITLYRGADTIDFRTRIDDFAGSDQLLRVEFQCDVPGARPLYDVGRGAIARTVGHPQVDAREHPWTQDNPAYGWFGLGDTAVVRELGPDGAVRARHGLGVAEVIADGSGYRAAAADAASEALGRALVHALAAAGVTATMSRWGAPRYGSSAGDSNRPDFRVVFGDPSGSPAVAAALAAVAPQLREAVHEAAAADGAVACWLPGGYAGRPAERPGADVTGMAELPCLAIVGTDRTALHALGQRCAAALATGCLDVPGLTAAGAGPADETARGRTVALINRGTPGSVVDPAGTLHMSLLRSSTGFPAGHWVDGERRTVPDGSSFQWQHWSHDFDYQLIAGDGDWRDLGVDRRAREFNQPLLARPTGAHDGPLPPEAALLRLVDPATGEDSAAELVCVKPYGNPLTRGGTVAATAPELLVRIAEPLGRPAVVVIETGPEPRRPPAAVLASVLEPPTDSPRDYPGAAIQLAARSETSVVLSAVRLRPDVPGIALRAGAAGQAAPAFARYWLHNDGPAPAGNQPVSVLAEPPLLHADAPGPLEFTALLASELCAAPADLTLEVSAPDGWAVDVPRTPVRLGPDDYTRLPVRVRRPDAAEPGTYFLRLAACAAGTEIVHDFVTVELGPSPQTGLLTSSVPAELTLTPGTAVTLTVTLTTTARTPVHATAHLVTPFGGWDWTPQARLDDVVIHPATPTAVSFSLTPPCGTPPTRTWALVKVTAHGQLHYAQATAITVAAR